jgi:aminopeptidase N
MQFAANFSAVIVRRIEEDFGVGYPMKKMDFVVSENYPVGGMESWGLVMFHHNALSLSPVGESDGGGNGARAGNRGHVDRLWAEYKVEKITTHELVHQWFGNLVSVGQWEELWLSEGFATYFDFDFLNEQHPHLTEHEYYLNLIDLISRQSSTSRDALVHPIFTMGDLNDLLGSVHLYTKGAMMVKMLKDLLGTFDFRAGMTRYLKQFAYKTVSAKELWSCLPTYAMDHGADQVKIAELMESWLTNRGVPEVMVM